MNDNHELLDIEDVTPIAVLQATIKEANSVVDGWDDDESCANENGENNNGKNATRHNNNSIANNGTNNTDGTIVTRHSRPGIRCDFCERPSNDGPIMAPFTAYTWESVNDWPNAKHELPLYKTLNRNEDDYWNYLVDELLLSRVQVVLFHGRGCLDPKPADASCQGVGNLCPRHLKRFVAAVERAKAQDVIRVGMWDDEGACNKVLQVLEDLPKGTRMDLSNPHNWNCFWEHNIQIWFGTIPKLAE